jgi:hypothetical protein
MGILCENLGYLVVYRKNGEVIELDHQKTVKICEKAQEEGKGLDDVIRKTMFPDLKTIRMKF